MPSRRTTPARASVTALLLLLIALSGGLLDTGAAHAEPVVPHVKKRASAAEADPLQVTIDALSPSALKPDPAKGKVVVSGTITNRDQQSWQALNVYALIGSSPLTTETELTEASLTDPDQQVGNRITSYGDFATIPELAPGQSTQYSLTIPRADLKDSAGRTITAPGVYWFGIQVLGSNTVGRDNLADGQARSFLPLVDKRIAPGGTERAAIVLPLRQRVLRQPDGTLVSPDTWVRRISPGGRLNALVNFGAGHPVSWLVDPAVIDAVSQLAAGNPPRSMATTDPGQPPAPAPSPTAAMRAAAVDANGASAARDWLSRLTDALKQSPAVYALPYGDLDLASAARHDPGLYPIARKRSSDVLAALGVTAQPVDAPIAGYLPVGAFSLGEGTTPVLLSDQAVSGTVPAVASFDARTVVTTSSLVAAGGPPPGDTLGLVPLRQELLAQAALRLGGDDPVVAVLPATWTPGTGVAGFFDGLARPWLDLTDIGAATGGITPQPLEASRLRYPDVEFEHELPAQTFTAVDGLRALGATLQRVVSHNGTVGTTLLDDALTSASYTARGGAGGEAAERTREMVSAMLRRITVEAPPSVTLSSTSGRFSATVVNGLDQPITVKVHPIGDNGMSIASPHRLDIPAKGRASVLMTASAHTNGVHTVTLQLTDTSGHPLGSDATLPIRTAQVSRIIWVFIGCGVGLLFTAIVVRLARRIRGGRAPEDRADPGDTGAEGEVVG